MSKSVSRSATRRISPGRITENWSQSHSKNHVIAKDKATLIKPTCLIKNTEVTSPFLLPFSKYRYLFIFLSLLLRL